MRTIAPNRTQETWLVDHHSQLLLNVNGVYPVPGCELVLQTTQLENIYLADLATSDTRNKVYKMPQIAIREIDMQRNTFVAIEIKAATQTAGTRVCKQQHETWDSTPIPIQPGLFSLVHGDLYYKFSCPNKTAEILE